jgi:hypothetical protein
MIKRRYFYQKQFMISFKILISFKKELNEILSKKDHLVFTIDLWKNKLNEYF